MSPGKRILFTTFGSLGDLHPFVALALGLKACGHEPAIATSAMYREKIEAEGIGFHAVRPDIAAFGDLEETIRRATHHRTGPEYVVRQLVMPFVRASYEDLSVAAQGADLLVTHSLTYAAPLIAEKNRIPWAATLLQPMVFFSIYDPPVLGAAPFLTWFRRFGPRFYGPLSRFLKRTVSSWAEPVRRLRADLGLPPVASNPMFEGQFSPHLNLALFSEVLASPQPDWPPHTMITGFPFFDRDETAGTGAAELARFLASGPPPVVFTLGSSAVMDAGTFFSESIAAVRKLKQRAVLVIGRDPRNVPKGPLPEGILPIEYAPFSELFPHASAIVHQGGIGTLAQALRAGRPMLIMPFSHDQPDNADRAVRLGVARTLARNRYTAPRVAAELQELLTNPRYAAEAEAAGRRVGAEDGVRAACDAIEALLER